ncbi:MAG: hypothetical protein AB1473_02900 [Thermodesulfobacteriota bacterium]
MSNQESSPIPVIATIRDAVTIPWRQQAIMFRALVPISLVLIALLTAMERMKVEAGGMIYALVFYILFIPAFAVFAITCHRLILLGGDSVPKHGLAKWTRRETRFVGWTLLIGFYYLCIGFVLAILLIGLTLFFEPLISPSPVVMKLAGGATAVLVWIPCLYWGARYSILLPATAVDERPNLEWAWKVSQGNGWRLVLVVGVLPMALQTGPGFLLGYSIVVDVLLHAATCILYVIEIAALSLSYRYLTGAQAQSVGCDE